MGTTALFLVGEGSGKICGFYWAGADSAAAETPAPSGAWSVRAAWPRDLRSENQKHLPRQARGEPEAPRVHATASPGRSPAAPLRCSLQVWWSRPRGPRVRTFSTKRSRGWWGGSPERAGGRQALGTAPAFSLWTLLCLAAQRSPLTQTVAPRPPRAPSQLTEHPRRDESQANPQQARGTHAPAAAPAAGRRGDPRASGSSGSAGREPAAAASGGRWALK